MGKDGEPGQAGFMVGILFAHRRAIELIITYRCVFERGLLGIKNELMRRD